MMHAPAPVVGTRRKKTKLFTRRQLHRARLRKEREVRAAAKAEKAQARRRVRDERRVEAAFRGCDV